MNYKPKLLILLLILFLNPLNAQSSEIGLTGNLNIDTKMLSEKNNYESLPQISFQTQNKKSPFLAGLFSLVVPGSGEVYAGNYWKAAIFVALEAAVITTAVIYDNKGNNQTEKFENFADENWSVVKYAEYLNSQGANIPINPDQSLPPWQRVNWSELNASEHGSHELPPYGTQQYYELIGKYHQYIPGWPGGNDIVNPPQIMLNYSGMRGEANDFYNIASKMVILIYVNHFLSALDAAWTAISYNNSIAVNMRMEEKYFGDRMELVPTIKLSLAF